GIAAAADDQDRIVGVAPGAFVHNYKVLGDNGSTDVSVVIAAVEHITAKKLAHPRKPMVVNLSLGEDIGTTDYTALDEAIETSIDAGVVYIVAAGNANKNANQFTPAHVHDVITVGSYDMDGRFSSFSNWGPRVDLLAPGRDVISLAPGNTGVVEMSGTSMAAAHVSGAAALLLSRYPTATPAQVRDILVNYGRAFVTGTPNNTTNRSVWVGVEPNGVVTAEVRVSEDNDDAEEYADGRMYLNSSDLELGFEGQNRQTVGLRFRNTMIPRGVTITNAYIQFQTDETDSSPAAFLIQGQDANDARAFSSTPYDITSRPRTTAGVVWTPAAWTQVGAAGAKQRTPDIKAILQEMVNRSRWAGDDLAFIITGTGQRTAESYKGNANAAPVLHVEWHY
ncbi:MAG TPA: S8 family serine peptidase, partial [Rhodothermales bacterium]|nr:S8 family serine peptidase [Rhodothermales bacterium]